MVDNKTTHAGWSVGEREPLSTVGGVTNWESVERITTKLKIILPYDSAISLFSTFPKDLTSYSVKAAWS